LVQTKLKEWNVRSADLENVLPDGMVRDQKHVEAAVRYFKEQKIDALFIPHCNFGTEGAAAMIAKQCGVPVLLWAPRDDAPLPDGRRLRDSLCGTLATSGVLYTLRIPFSYINNCRVEDEEFRIGVERFVGAARVVKKLKSMKIGQIGQRIDFFWSTIANEADLLQKFGIEIMPIDLAELCRNIRRRVEAEKNSYRAQLAQHKTWICFNGYREEDDILHNYALRDILLETARENDLDAFTIQTFNSIPNEFGSFLNFGCSLVEDCGYPVAAESDLYGAVSSALVAAAAPHDEPSFFPEPTVRHPTNDNAVLLWHGHAPFRLRNPHSLVKVDMPWILKDLPTGGVHFKLKDGPITLCRFAGDSDGYRLGYGEGRTVDGPYTQEFYAWMEVDNWPRWERQFVEGPYIHHCSCSYGHFADILKESSRFIANLQFERFGESK
jgi:L-fucose isomerase-like protein